MRLDQIVSESSISMQKPVHTSTSGYRKVTPTVPVQGRLYMRQSHACPGSGAGTPDRVPGFFRSSCPTSLFRVSCFRVSRFGLISGSTPNFRSDMVLELSVLGVKKWKEIDHSAQCGY